MISRLPQEFYGRDTVTVARELLGCLLTKQTENGEVLIGRISETEAYLSDDPACHAFRGKTPRNTPMFGEPGRAYVYFTYGMHHCFNVVTEREGVAGAVLVRALEPLEGLERMAANRRLTEAIPNSETEVTEQAKIKRGRFLCGGPGKLCQAFALNLEDNKTDLTQSETLFLSRDPERFSSLPPEAILATPRIGISIAKEFPYRFTAKGERYASR